MSAAVSNAITRPVKLSQALARVVGNETSTRANITKGVWAYIKTKNLQDAEKKSIIKCDETLKAVFGKDVITHTEIMKLVQPHITKIDVPAAPEMK